MGLLREGGKEEKAGCLGGGEKEGKEGRGGSSLGKGCWEPFPASLGHLGGKKTAKEICEMTKRSQV